MGRKLEWVATGNSGRCVASGLTLTIAYSIKEAERFRLFLKANLGSLPLIWLRPQVDSRVPIYCLVAIFETSVCYVSIDMISFCCSFLAEMT
jgi:hypothetical protein